MLFPDSHDFFSYDDFFNVLYGVIFIRTLHSCVYPFCRVLFNRDFVEAALIFVADSRVVSFHTS